MNKQRHDRDCLQTCLSELLHINYSDIPEFHKISPDKNRPWSDEEITTFKNTYDNFLNSHNYFRITIDTPFIPDKNCVKMPYLSLNNFKCIGILQKPSRHYSHCVLLEITNNKDISLLDPKPNSDYELSDITQIELIFKI